MLAGLRSQALHTANAQRQPRQHLPARFLAVSRAAPGNNSCARAIKALASSVVNNGVVEGVLRGQTAFPSSQPAVSTVQPDVTSHIRDAAGDRQPELSRAAAESRRAGAEEERVRVERAILAHILGKAVAHHCWPVAPESLFSVCPGRRRSSSTASTWP